MTYQPRYRESWALVIGIDQYQHAGPLQHAQNDARAFRDLLVSRFNFPPGNVALLLNEEASGHAIRAKMARFTENGVEAEDRVIVFFAGHGDTRVSRRGDVGYLVPHDGNPAHLETLVRWDELTRIADMIAAKHLLFLMDACYGGLVLTRGLKPGSMRFATDMLTRYARQALTAGKADETVADGGGPRAGHSMFTGHLLDALEGRAAGIDGLLTASNVTSYVYERVGKDMNSAQSPHYGHLDGDGDLIFNPPPEETSQPEFQDILVQVPANLDSGQGGDSFETLIKTYIAEPKNRIALDDLLASEIRKYLHATREETLSVNAPRPNSEALAERLLFYKTISARLLTALTLIARWGTREHRPLLSRALVRMADNNDTRGGITLWLNLRWYPVLRTLYALTIASVASEQYENLNTAFCAELSGPVSGSGATTILVAAMDHSYECADAFKLLQGHERHLLPLNEHLFQDLQAPLENLLFLGRSYESLFDQCEMLMSLVNADLSQSSWIAPGRFNWKHSRRHGESPVSRFLDTAVALGDRWVPIGAGLFNADPGRLAELATAMRARADAFRAH